MSEFSTQLLIGLLRASALLSLGFIVVLAMLRCLKIRSPKAHTLCWTVVLLQGVILIPISIDVPVLSGTESIPQNPPAIQMDFNEPLVGLTEPDWNAARTPLPNPPSLQSDWSPASMLVWIWISGICLLLATKARQYVVFAQQVAGQRCDGALEEWTQQWRTTCRETGLADEIPFCVTENFGPCVCWLRGESQLLIPEQHWHELSAVQRELVLRHEAAHIKRHDLWRSLLVQILASVQWFNPFAWLCARKLAECSEWACDDIVRRQPSANISEYVKALLEFSVSSHRVPAFVTSASAHSVVRRARRLLNPKVKEDSGMKKLITTLAAITLTVTGLLHPNLVAKDSDVETTAEAKTKADVVLTEDEKAKDLPEKKPSDSKDKDIESQGVTLTIESSDPAETVKIQHANQIVSANRFELSSESLAVRPGTREAVVDMAHLFKHLPEFEKQRAALQERLNLAEKRAKAEHKAIQAIAQQLKDAAPEDRESLEKQIAERHAELTTQKTVAKRRLMTEEAKIYASVYKKIRTAIAEHAKEHRIDIVRRATISSKQPDRINSHDPKVVMQALNSEVLYVADDGKIDITEAVLKRLTKPAKPTSKIEL